MPKQPFNLWNVPNSLTMLRIVMIPVFVAIFYLPPGTIPAHWVNFSATLVFALAAITDWLDADDDVSALGVERDYYLSLESPYLPRNGPMRTLGEMELIAGVWPKYFRGEDWNLDNRLDPNEDDSARSFPPDNPDGILDGGWSSRLTVYSTMGGATESGQPRIYLKQANSDDLEKRLGVNTAQADALIQYGKSDTATLADLLTTPLTGVAANANNANNNNGNANNNGQSGGNNSGNNSGAGGRGNSNNNNNNNNNNNKDASGDGGNSNGDSNKDASSDRAGNNRNNNNRGGNGNGNNNGGGRNNTGGNNNGGGNNGNNSGANNNNKNDNPGGGTGPAAVPPLTEKQLHAVLAETSMEDPLDRKPGKMNINTISTQLLRDILSSTTLDESIVDELIYMRDSRPQGITSIIDFQKIPNITPDDLKIITRRFDTVSNVFTISSRGRSWASGLEVEIVAVVDRSTVPVRIIEYREQ